MERGHASVAIELFRTRSHSFARPCLRSPNPIIFFSYILRFEQAGTMSDLEEAIRLYREALATWPPGHPYRLYSLHNLGSSLLSLFRFSGSENDIDEAVDLLEEVLALRPMPHPLRPGTLRRLADALEARFNFKGVVEDRDEAVRLRAEIEMSRNQ
ncbi:mucin-like protein 1 [Coprinopsis cinerea AmutBmut pab1-1]|nr:mucin-like protein 1 [Coprinopsis cinerea AmutBmut pab1-1]